MENQNGKSVKSISMVMMNINLILVPYLSFAQSQESAAVDAVAGAILQPSSRGQETNVATTSHSL